MKNSVLILLMAFLFSFGMQAQNPGDFDEDDEDQNPTDAPAVPIDGGLYILLIAGLSFGAHAMHKRGKKV